MSVKAPNWGALCWWKLCFWALQLEAAVEQPYKTWCFVTSCLKTWRTHSTRAADTEHRQTGHRPTGGHCSLTRSAVTVSAITIAAILKTTSMSTSRTIICLLRNDLRLHDNEVRLNLLSPYSCEIRRYLTLKHLLNVQVNVSVWRYVPKRVSFGFILSLWEHFAHIM